MTTDFDYLLGAKAHFATNNVNGLDPALIRPGRADCRLEFGPLDDVQLEALVTATVGEHRPLPKIRGTLMPAEVVEVVKRNMDDPLAALVDLRALLLAQKVAA